MTAFNFSNSIIRFVGQVSCIGWGLALISISGGCNIYEVAAPAPTHSPVEQLGRYLFFDPRLSATGTKSCSSCHDPQLAFTDGYRRSPGIYADPSLRNAPSLVNAVHLNTLNWANPDITTFEDQMLRPLFADNPAETGLLSRQKRKNGLPDSTGLPIEVVLKKLKTDQLYHKLFTAAWGISPDEWSEHRVIEAISAYEKTLISYNSPYDAWLRGDPNALSEEAQKGRALFFSNRLKCGKCHSGPLLTDGEMHNICFYNPSIDQGVFNETHKNQDRGKFRTPSLRNVALTHPYFHDGSIANLHEVITIFAAGGQQMEEPNKSKWITPFTLRNEEERQLLLFLESLTDSTVLTNPWFQNPFTY